MEKKNLNVEDIDEPMSKAAAKAEAEKAAKMNDLVAKGKKGKLSESDLDAVLEENDYEMLLVINKYRPLTPDAPSTVEVMREIETAGKIRFTGLVNNSNLGEETTAEDVLDSMEYAKSVSKQTGLPIVFTTVRAELAEELEGKIPDLFAIRLQKKIL